MGVFDRETGCLAGTQYMFLGVILLGGLVWLFDWSHKTPSELLEKGDVEGFRAVLQAHPTIATRTWTQGGTLISKAIKFERASAVRWLVKAGADVNEVDVRGNSLVSYALRNPEITLCLLEHGANANHIDARKYSLLHHAAYIGNELTIRALLLHDARVHARDPQGRTALHIVHGNKAGLAKCLLEYGAQPDIRDGFGTTPLHGMARRNEGAMAEVLIKAGANLTASSLQKWTPLHVAAMNGSIDVMIPLLEAGVEVDLLSEKGHTPMECAVRRGSIDSLQVLIGFGADLSRTDKKGNTLLHQAVIHGEYDVAKKLIRAGVPLELVNSDGYTAQELASLNDQAELLDVFQIASAKKR